MADKTQPLAGRFWLAEAPESHVGGWLDLSGRWPAVDLAEPLTKGTRERTRHIDPDTGTTTTTYSSADRDVDPNEVTLHGFTRSPPQNVTLVRAVNGGRSQRMGGNFMDPGSQRMRSSAAVLGAHVDGPDELYTRMRLRLTHLDVWAQLPGMSAEFTEDGSSVAIEYIRPEEEETVELTTRSGSLTLGSAVSAPDPSVRGAGIRTTAELIWEVAGEGLSLDALWSEVVEPIRTVLSLAAGGDSPVTGCQVRNAHTDRWLQVHHPNVHPPVEDGALLADPLLLREHLPLTVVGRWLDESANLNPVPQIVVDSLATSPDQTIESQVLELAAAAEGLHRRLFKKEAVMERTTARTAKAAAVAAVTDAMDDATIAERVAQALAHLDEPTFRDRLLTLLEYTNSVANFGGKDLRRRDEWTRRVAAARNGFAHQLTRSKAQRIEFEENIVLLNSLRWLGLAALLLAAGAEPEAIRDRLTQHRPFIHSRRQARVWMPAVYA